ncbi:MAG: hypothetical protein ACJ8NR_06580 [Sulfurifustis sp.]
MLERAQGHHVQGAARWRHVLPAAGFAFTASCAIAADVPPPAIYSIARLQAVYDNLDALQLTQSWYLANSARDFLLEVLDRNESFRSRAEDLTRAQLFFGGLISDRARPVLGWVGRLDYARTGVGDELADLRGGAQLNVDRLPPFADWFRRNRVELFVEVFPLRTNEDFGRFDTFTRFAFRFDERFAARGVVRTYRFDEGNVVTFENDVLYSFNRHYDVVVRLAKANRDRAGLAEKDFVWGAGLRFTF